MRRREQRFFSSERTRHSLWYWSIIHASPRLPALYFPSYLLNLCPALSLAHCWYLRPMANERSAPSAKTPSARRSLDCDASLERDGAQKNKTSFPGLGHDVSALDHFTWPKQSRDGAVAAAWHFSLISAHFRPHYFLAANAREWKTSPLSRRRLSPLPVCVRASLTLLENAATASFVHWLKIRPSEGESRSRLTMLALFARSFYPLWESLC